MIAALAGVTVFGEYGAEVAICAVIIAISFSIFFAFGSIAGGLYLIFYILEEAGVMDDNPVEYFFTVAFDEWLASFGAIDWVRVPIIWFEY